MSNKDWHFNQGAPIECTRCYLYAVHMKGYDNGKVGGDEMAGLCGALVGKPGSKCFSPKDGTAYYNEW